MLCPSLLTLFTVHLDGNLVCLPYWNCLNLWTCLSHLGRVMETDSCRLSTRPKICINVVMSFPLLIPSCWRQDRNQPALWPACPSWDKPVNHHNNTSSACLTLQPKYYKIKYIAEFFSKGFDFSPLPLSETTSRKSQSLCWIFKNKSKAITESQLIHTALLTLDKTGQNPLHRASSLLSVETCWVRKFCLLVSRP